MVCLFKSLCDTRCRAVILPVSHLLNLIQKMCFDTHQCVPIIHMSDPTIYQQYFWRIFLCLQNTGFDPFIVTISESLATTLQTILKLP